MVLGLSVVRVCSRAGAIEVAGLTRANSCSVRPVCCFLIIIVFLFLLFSRTSVFLFFLCFSLRFVPFLVFLLHVWM